MPRPQIPWYRITVLNIIEPSQRQVRRRYLARREAEWPGYWQWLSTCNKARRPWGTLNMFFMDTDQLVGIVTFAPYPGINQNPGRRVQPEPTATLDIIRYDLANPAGLVRSVRLHPFCLQHPRWLLEVPSRDPMVRYCSGALWPEPVRAKFGRVGFPLESLVTSGG